MTITFHRRHLYWFGAAAGALGGFFIVLHIFDAEPSWYWRVLASGYVSLFACHMVLRDIRKAIGI